MTDKSPLRSFSWQGYRDLLASFADAGYEAQFFDKADPADQHLIVRHDVDFSLKFALDVAKIEAEMGVRASYFVLLRTEFYNLCSPSDWDFLEDIVELGHDVGLHFDASLYGDDFDSLEKAALRECAILETILGRRVSCISFHRPAKALLGLDRSLAGRTHTYQPRFFSEMDYCSDSQGSFRFGHPLDRKAFLDRKAMQLLTHPIWWQKNEFDEPMQILDALGVARRKLIRQEMIENCKPYANYSQNSNEWKNKE